MKSATPALDAYDRHAAGAARCAALIGLISADHSQLWTRDRIITRCAEKLREDRGYSWEKACIRAERIYDGTGDPATGMLPRATVTPRRGSHVCRYCGAGEAMPGHEC